MSLNDLQLEQLWIQAGGDPGKAGLAAAIAQAESSGNQGATNHNTNGSTDYGYWQINSVHTQYDQGLLTSDGLYNAKAAVQISNNGKDFTPWTTFNDGAYKKYVPDALQAQVSTGKGGGILSSSGIVQTILAGPTKATQNAYAGEKAAVSTAAGGISSLLGGLSGIPQVGVFLLLAGGSVALLIFAAIHVAGGGQGAGRLPIPVPV